MKKNAFILLLLMMTMGYSASSQSINITKSNHSISSKELNYLSKITFAERTMRLHSIAGDTLKYPLANVQKIEFSGISTSTTLIQPVQNLVTMFPNPLSNDQLLTIRYVPQSQAPISLVAYNAAGQVVDYIQLFAQDFPDYQYKLHKFNPGFYLITLRQGNNIQTKKLFIY